VIGPRGGLYLRDDRITVVAVSGRRVALQYFTLEPGELPGARLKTELDTRQIRLRRMRIGLARPLLTVKILDLPSAGRAQLGEMVAFELERHVPFPPEEVRFDWTQLPATAKGPLRVLVAASERRTVEGALRLLEEPRLKPGALTAGCHDLPVLVRGRQPARHIVWAHRAGGATDLVCLSQGRLELSRTVPIKDTDELARELMSTTRLLGWDACDAVWVSGDDAAEVLASSQYQELGAPASEPPWRPTVRALIEKLPEDDVGTATLALAIALGSNRPQLNLLPKEARPRTLSTGQLVTAATAVVTGLLAVALLAGQGFQQHRYAERLSRAIRALDPEVKKTEALAAELSQKRQLLDTIGSIEKANIRPLGLLKELTERIPQEAWLRTFTMDKQGLEISGQATAANQLIPLLESSPSLERAEFTAPVTKAGDKEQFRIKAAWKTAAKPPEPAPKPPAPASPPGRPAGAKAPGAGAPGR
jgi:general secretion pathway protein L